MPPSGCPRQAAEQALAACATLPTVVAKLSPSLTWASCICTKATLHKR